MKVNSQQPPLSLLRETTNYVVHTLAEHQGGITICN